MTDVFVDRSAGPLRVEVLHHFRVLGPHFSGNLSESAEWVIAQLAVGDRPQTRDALAGALWPDRADRDALATVRRALWRVNRAAPGLVHRAGHYLALAAEVELDLRDLYRIADDVAAGMTSQLDSRAVRLLESELLPQWSFDWLESCRESLRQLRLHTLETVARTNLDAGRPGAALTTALAAVGVDPLRESAHRIVVAAHLREDNTVAALRHYSRYRDQLWHELQLRPSRQMQTLIESSGAAAAVGSVPPRGRAGRSHTALRSVRTNTGTRG